MKWFEHRDGYAKATHEREPSPTVDNGLNRAECDKTAPTLESILDEQVVKNDILQVTNRQRQRQLDCEVRPLQSSERHVGSGVNGRTD